MKCQTPPNSPTEAFVFGERALLSPPSSPPLGFSDLGGIRTTSTITIQERGEPISFRPLDEDPWVAFLLPPEHLCPGSKSMELINILPCIHVVNEAGHLVAAAFSRVMSLRGIGIPLQDVDSSDLTKCCRGRDLWMP
ncbi:hypothetical protein SPI_01587 [Niveomyces insectorum RCEF 264]|uniref:Uncharacterized protein n=1 Tax=Niveomyces insectorum RCEF 264 TaxID=1081102 RepID=A0A167Z2U7_9HYPO|nr:hypothetical protein SPI_01587 [Niveomyces insectorum RCEF 264]